MRHDPNYSNLEPTPYCGFVDDCKAVYSGIAGNAEINETFENDNLATEILVRTVMVTFIVVDTPLSFCLDTVCLPWDINWDSDNEEKQSNQRVDLTVKTPVESGKEQGTAGHP
jgi:uncharacterized protein YceK